MRDLRTRRSHNVLVVAWPDRSTAEDVRRAQQELRAIGRAYPRGVAMLNVIHQSIALGTVDESTRTEARMLMALRDVPLVASAVVFPGTGFGAAILRSVVSGLSLVSGAERPIRVFSHPAESEAWLAAMLGRESAHAPGELARAVSELVSHERSA